MDVSRRAFFKTAAATAAGTALGGLAGFGANLSPVLARAEELRIKNAKGPQLYNFDTGLWHTLTATGNPAQLGLDAGQS